MEGAGDLGGTMRLGLYPAKLAEGSIVREVYDDQPYVEERHRHRYEVNNAYRAELEKKAGIVFSGTSPDNKLVEYVEYPRETHPYLVATQAHPELRSRPTRPHPLFAGLVKAAVERQSGEVAAQALPLTGVGSLSEISTPVSVCGRAKTHAQRRQRQEHRGHRRGMAGDRDRDPVPAATRPASAPTTWSCPTARSSAATTRSTRARSPSSPSTPRTGSSCCASTGTPCGNKLWEIPAGLLDVPGENPLHAAQRELYEEAHIKAEEWRVLTDVYTTPGGCDEAVRDLPRPRSLRGRGPALRGLARRRPTWSSPGCRSRSWCAVRSPASCTTTAWWWGCSRSPQRCRATGLDTLRPAEAPLARAPLRGLSPTWALRGRVRSRARTGADVR